MALLNPILPLSLWVQLASFFFTLSGVYGDILVIRFFLFLSYCMLFINAALGAPLWSNFYSQGSIALDSLAWSILGLYVHGASLVNLLFDERPIDLSEDEAALWRMFYRTGGLSKRLFYTIVAPDMQVVEFEAGQEIPTDEYFYIVYQGRVNIKVYEEDSDELKVSRIIGSGRMFDVSYLGFFSEDSVLAKNQIRCWCVDRARLFRFSRAALKTIAHHQFAKHVWQALLINNLSSIVDTRDRALDVDKSDHIFSPLQPWEEPRSALPGSGTALRNPLGHLVNAIISSFSPPSPFGGHPSGIRHVSLPAPGQPGTSNNPNVTTNVQSDYPA